MRAQRPEGLTESAVLRVARNVATPTDRAQKGGGTTTRNNEATGEDAHTEGDESTRAGGLGGTLKRAVK